jgi:hypothetical protein
MRIGWPSPSRLGKKRSLRHAALVWLSLLLMRLPTGSPGRAATCLGEAASIRQYFVVVHGLRLRGGGHNIGAARKSAGRGLSHDQVAFREKASVAKVIPLADGDSLGGESAQTRHVPVPPNRFTHLKRHWSALSAPIVQTLRLQVRMNLRRRAVELRTCEFTADAGALGRAADMLQAFLTGFSVDDALAMVRLEVHSAPEGRSFRSAPSSCWDTRGCMRWCASAGQSEAGSDALFGRRGSSSTRLTSRT